MTPMRKIELLITTPGELPNDNTIALAATHAARHLRAETGDHAYFDLGPWRACVVGDGGWIAWCYLTRLREGGDGPR